MYRQIVVAIFNQNYFTNFLLLVTLPTENNNLPSQRMGYILVEHT